MEEIADLPHTLTPHETWQQHTTTTTSPSVILDVDSATDTDSDVGGIGGDESSEPDYGEYENSSSNWELEMLVEQMRERRSASLDHNPTVRTMRKRFARSESADTRRD